MHGRHGQGAGKALPGRDGRTLDAPGCPDGPRLCLDGGICMSLFSTIGAAGARSGEQGSVFAGNLCLLGGGNLKSTQDKLERQQKADRQIAFWEGQKENLKSMKCDTVEEIKEKLEMFHHYEEEVAAAKKQYNMEQMKHILDEAQEMGEQNAKAAEQAEPKTPEERREEMREEALGEEKDESVLEEMLEEMPEELKELEEVISETQKEQEAELEEQSMEAQTEYAADAEKLEEQSLEAQAERAAEAEELEEQSLEAQAERAAEAEELEEQSLEAQAERAELEEQSLEARTERAELKEQSVETWAERAEELEEQSLEARAERAAEAAGRKGRAAYHVWRENEWKRRYYGMDVKV